MFQILHVLSRDTLATLQTQIKTSYNIKNKTDIGQQDTTSKLKLWSKH